MNNEIFSIDDEKIKVMEELDLKIEERRLSMEELKKQLSIIYHPFWLLPTDEHGKHKQVYEIARKNLKLE